MKMGTADLNGCRLTFFEVVYEKYDPPQKNFMMKIHDRPNMKPDLRIMMTDWDDLLYYADTLFTRFNVKYPLTVLTYDKDFKLRTPA